MWAPQFVYVELKLQSNETEKKMETAAGHFWMVKQS